MLMVLVVEDEPLIRAFIADAIFDEGFEVLEAGHAADAIAILEDHAIDIHLLFTDVRMPGEMDGLALSHHVVAHWPWIGLLVTSAHFLRPDSLPPACRYLSKPYLAREVVHHLREIVSAV